MNKKIVITHSSILTERWAKYYCLDVLAEKFDIEYWDCSNFTYPNFGGKEITGRPYLKKIRDLDNFKVHVQNLPQHTLIVNDMHFTKHNYPTHLVLSKRFKNIIYINFFANAQNSDTLDANDTKKKTLGDVIHGYIYNITCRYDFLLKLKCFVRGYSKDKIKELNKAKYFVRTESLYKIHFINTAKTGKYVINLPDLEDVLAETGTPRLIKERYVVYVGQFIPYHPEIISNNPQLNVDSFANEYYDSMNRFFDEIEKTTSFKVVIAEHPVSHYGCNPYGGREIYVGKTAKLVCDAEAVLIHGSGAIDFSLLYNKPTILVHNKYIREMCNIWNPEQNIAKAMSLPMADTEETFISEMLELQIDPGIRRKYMEFHFGSLDIPLSTNAELFERYYNELFDIIYLGA